MTRTFAPAVQLPAISVNEKVRTIVNINNIIDYGPNEPLPSLKKLPESSCVFDESSLAPADASAATASDWLSLVELTDDWITALFWGSAEDGGVLLDSEVVSFPVLLSLIAISSLDPVAAPSFSAGNLSVVDVSFKFSTK